MAKRFISAVEEATAASIGGVPTCKPLIVAQTATLQEAVFALEKTSRGACVVVDDAGKAVGMFTERDVVRHINAGEDGWLGQSIIEAMSPITVTLQPSMTIAAALECMNAGPYRRLPIVDADGAPHGIVSIWDVMGYIAEHFPQRFFNLPPRPELETRNLWGG